MKEHLVLFGLHLSLFNFCCCCLGAVGNAQGLHLVYTQKLVSVALKDDKTDIETWFTMCKPTALPDSLSS